MKDDGSNQQCDITKADEVERFIRTFEARIPPDDWAVIGDFVRDAIRDAKPRDAEVARRFRPPVMRLVHWAWRSAGYELDREVIFRRSVVSAFISHGCDDLADSTRATYRTFLHQVSSALLASERRPPAQEAIANDNASMPYSAKEVASLRAWASNQNTTYRSMSAQVLLALGFGAGLTNSEIINVAARDIQIDDEGALVLVHGERERVVPLLSDWAEIPATIARAAIDKDMFLLCPRRGKSTYAKTVTGFIEDSSPSGVRLSTRRMRATWIVTHMTAHVPAYAIAEAAGNIRPEGLARYAKYVPAIEPVTIRAWLHGKKESPKGE